MFSYEGYRRIGHTLKLINRLLLYMNNLFIHLFIFSVSIWKGLKASQEMMQEMKE